MTSPATRLSWVTPLLLGAGLLTVSNGRWIWPLAAWLVAAPWLVFTRRAPRRLLPVGLAAAILVQLLTWHGLIPAPGVTYVMIITVYATVAFLPLLIDRILARRLNGIPATLVYPTAAVAIEFLFHRYATPYGSWLSTAYSQTGNLPLMQLASITGIAGVSWLLAWCGAIVATRWERRPRDWHTEVAFAITALAVLAFGQVRVSRTGERGEPMRVAGLVADPELSSAVMTQVDAIEHQGDTTAGLQWDSLRLATVRLNDDLLHRTEREAAAGADLVAWSETAGRVLQADERALLERAAEVARNRHVVLGVAYGVFVPNAPKPFRNRVAVIDSSGSVAFVTDKAHPIVGAESPVVAPGDGVLRFLPAGFGRVTAVICHDLDFPTLLRQAGLGRATLVLGPSDDWPAITRLHAGMAIVRAIEQGFTLFRPTAHGRSLVAGPTGALAARLDAPEDAFVAVLRPERRRTVYTAIGDLFSWGCVAALLGLLLIHPRRPAGPSMSRVT